ncbi:hypothetical protein FQZ97_859250 [compost metagenome]
MGPCPSFGSRALMDGHDFTINCPERYRSFSEESSIGSPSSLYADANRKSVANRSSWCLSNSKLAELSGVA